MAERDNRGPRRDRDENPEFADRLVAINRVSKTVKGGKRFGFAALVVVGDQKGRVGFGKGKAKEVPEAIRKATEQAKRSLIRVPLREGRTLHHDIEGRHGAGRVVMRQAVAGTGIIAGGPMRAVFEMLGLQDVVSKSLGSTNPYNMIRATMDGLLKEQSPRTVASRRGKKVAEILRQPGEAAQAAARSGGGLSPWPRPSSSSRSPPRAAARHPAPDPDRPGAEQDAQDPRARGHPLGARHGQQDPAPREDHRGAGRVGPSGGAGLPIHRVRPACRSAGRLPVQRSSDMKLNELRDNPGATKKRKRIGRGPGSGMGKTGGRGVKGQKSRAGVSINAYEGGQMPLYQRLPKRGFTKPNRKEYSVVNLGLIQKFIDAGKLDATAEIDEAALVAAGVMRRARDGVRVLGKGALTSKVALKVDGGLRGGGCRRRGRRGHARRGRRRRGASRDGLTRP